MEEGKPNWFVEILIKKGMAMLSEHQPYIKDFCSNCGMALYDCRDWSYPRWEYECWDVCDHRAANDPELKEIDDELGEIIDRISESTRKIRYYQSCNKEK